MLNVSVFIVGSLLVKYSKNKLVQKMGKAEFDIPGNVLGLIYTQSLCWLALPFSPIFPLLITVQLFLVFYLQKLMVLHLTQASSKVYPVSRSYFFFSVVLVFAFILCCIPLGYVTFKMAPPQDCGPFVRPDCINGSSHLYDVVIEAVESWPGVLKSALQFILSAGVAVSLVTFLIVIIYYCYVANRAKEALLHSMKKQLCSEGSSKLSLKKELAVMHGRW